MLGRRCRTAHILASDRDRSPRFVRVRHRRARLRDRGRDLSLDVSPAQLRDELQDELGKALLTGHPEVDDPLRGAVLAMVGETSAVRSGDDVTAAEIQSLTTSLHRLTPRPDVLRRITAR